MKKHICSFSNGRKHESSTYQGMKKKPERGRKGMVQREGTRESMERAPSRAIMRLHWLGYSSTYPALLDKVHLHLRVETRSSSSSPLSPSILSPKLALQLSLIDCRRPKPTVQIIKGICQRGKRFLGKENLG